MFDTLPAIDHWRGFVKTHYGFWDGTLPADQDGEKVIGIDQACSEETLDTTPAVEIGVASEDFEQQLLTTDG